MVFFCVFLVSSPSLPPPLQPMEVYVDDETKLTLHGLQQHYVKLQESEKNRKLFDLLDLLEFNQVSTACILLTVLEFVSAFVIASSLVYLEHKQCLNNIKIIAYICI